MKAVCVTAAALAGVALATVAAQDRLRTMPGYEHYQRMTPLIAGSWVSGAINPRWESDSRAFTFTRNGKSYRFDLATRVAAEVTERPPAAAPAGRGARDAGRGGGQTGRGTLPAGRQSAVLPTLRTAGGGAEQAQHEMPRVRMAGCPPLPVARGRQAVCVMSPDGARKAFYRDRNFWVANADGSREIRVTTDGSQRARIKYGVASWVYGEELAQTTAMWWSPDSRKVAFYRFDESQVKDFYLAMNQTDLQTTLDAEAYPKAGTPNPIADVFVYHVTPGRTVRLDVRGGRPFDNAVVGHYVYNIRWRADSREVLLNRADRRQQILEFAACASDTGRCRTVLREEWPTGWIETYNGPAIRWLSDETRFIWQSSRSGWANYYLYDLSGRLIAPLTRNAFDAAGIVKIDEEAGVMFYAARDGDNFLRIQIHRVGLDGAGDVRLTDPAFHHSVGSCLPQSGASGRSASSPACGISPDNQYLVDVYQRHDRAPATQLLDADGRVVAQIAEGDAAGLDHLGFRRAEQFTYLAADGVTRLYGQISFPSGFDPAVSYPVLVPVYGGPVAFSHLPTETFVPPHPTAEYGFLIVHVMYRGVPGTGKRAADSLYRNLGRTEMDDMALGVKALWSRPYVDKARVGIYGSSYGGYTAAMQLLRYPDVFAAAASSSPPTDWRNYDTIYTERYMGLPDENAAGYDAGALATHVPNLKGRLLLYYATADNNVHPNNALQFIRALQRANKSFEVQVGPDLPHGAVNAQRMMEFFIENLVMRPERLIAR